MNTEDTKEELYSKRAKEALKTVIIYFNVTRPQYMKGYRITDKFSREEMNRQLAFLSKWKNIPKEVKNFHAKEYANYSANYNYTFGVPQSLVWAVCRSYRDENRNVRRVKAKDIVELLAKEGFIESDRPKHGIKHQNHQVKVRWCNKYPIADKALLDQLFSDPKYKSIDKFPIPGELGSPEELGFIDAKNALVKWEKEQGLRGDGKTKKPVEAEEKKPETDAAKWAKRYANDYIRGLATSYSVENEMRACHASQKDIHTVIDVLDKLKREEAERKRAERIKKDEEYKARRLKEYKVMRAKYDNGELNYQTFRTWMIEHNATDEALKKLEDENLMRMNEKAQEKEEKHVKLNTNQIDELLKGMTI